MTFSITPRPDKLPLVSWSPEKGRPQNHVVVIHSPKGGSGKTSTTLFCATTLAELGARVLLVEATEGQAPLTHAFFPASAEVGSEQGLGPHLFHGIAPLHTAPSFATAMKLLLPVMAREAPVALASLRPVYVTPDRKKSLDFLPAGSAQLGLVQQMTVMQDRDKRKALLQAFVDALVAAHPRGGWDFIFIDILPSAESTITRAAIGLADTYILVVDVESSHPLVGFSHINAEIQESITSRKADGRSTEVFKGLVLNRVGRAKSRTYTEKVNRALIAAQQRESEATGRFIPILREIPRLQTLTLLGFNYLAVKALKARYPGGLPDDLDNLSDEDIEVILSFRDGIDANGNDFEAAAGVAWLIEANPLQRDRLLKEADSLAPLILAFGDGSALDAYVAAIPDGIEEIA